MTSDSPEVSVEKTSSREVGLERTRVHSRDAREERRQPLVVELVLETRDHHFEHVRRQLKQLALLEAGEGVRGG